MEWPACLDEYEKLIIRMNTPRVVIDNSVCASSTVVKVDSARKHGILLEAVQVLTDLNLWVKKAYISSDGRWFMDVFHVTDQNGNKLTDASVISYIEQALTASASPRVKEEPKGFTALELTGTDRPGLLSELFAVLSDLHCCVVEGKVWTHNGRVASLIYVKDEHSGSPIQDSIKIEKIVDRMKNVLKGSNDIRSAKMSVSMAVTHTERRLHQLMFADRDYERKQLRVVSATAVSVEDWSEREYSIVSVRCKDRPKLLFDTVCTMTDMHYVVFHATVDTDSTTAHLEFYIRHLSGRPISSEAERQRLILCLEAAVERRQSEGVRLELETADRSGLLADVTRTFRENGLSITHADISTSGNTTGNIFCVKDAAGLPADPKIIEAVRQTIGHGCLRIKETLPRFAGLVSSSDATAGSGMGLLALGSLVKRNLYSLGLIRSCT